MGKNGYFAFYLTVHWNLMCLNLHISLSTFGKHCSTHIMSCFVCHNDLLFNKWVCIFFLVGKLSHLKKSFLSDWGRCGWGGWGNLETTTFAAVMHWFKLALPMQPLLLSWMEDAEKLSNCWNYTKQPLSARVITFISRPLVMKNLTWGSCFPLLLFKGVTCAGLWVPLASWSMAVFGWTPLLIRDSSLSLCLSL